MIIAIGSSFAHVRNFYGQNFYVTLPNNFDYWEFELLHVTDIDNPASIKFFAVGDMDVVIYLEEIIIIVLCGP